MPLTPHRGMDHDLYRYEPISERPRLVWPNDAAMALCVVLHFEYWEYDPPKDAYRDPRYRNVIADLFPDDQTYSIREYGNRIGAFRLMDALDRHGVKVTVAANSEACRRYPYLVEQFRKRGWEFAAHGSHATRMITSKMSEAEERAFIEESRDTVAAAAGQAPRGWIGQDFGETPRTPELVAQAGFDYIADWPNDDQPYRLTTPTPLLSLPYHCDLDDAQLLWLRQLGTPRYPGLVADAAERLCAEGRESGRMLTLGIRPWLFGMASRIRYLDEALAAAMKMDGVWSATAGEIADAFAAQEGQS